MSESNGNNNQKYAIYDNMNTEVLEEILRSDSRLPDGEDSDIDSIFYIMEVIAKREKEQPTGKFTDVQAAWTSFSDNYLPYIENDKSLYDDEETRDKPDIKQIPFYNSSSPSQKRRLQLKTAHIAAIVTIMLFFSTITASALDFDLWDTVAKWTKDTFGFTNVIINKQEPDDLQETLNKYGLSTEVAPTWFPDGYSFESVDIAETPLRTIINSIYSSKDGEISITIIMLANSSSSTYEKDSNDVITYSVNGIDYYIMTNLERTKVVWMIDNYECSITGKISIEESKKMIDSIYSK